MMSDYLFKCNDILKVEFVLQCPLGSQLRKNGSFNGYYRRAPYQKVRYDNYL